jgi:hypothetical protein
LDLGEWALPPNFGFAVVCRLPLLGEPEVPRAFGLLDYVIVVYVVIFMLFLMVWLVLIEAALTPVVLRWPSESDPNLSACPSPSTW